MEDIGNIVYWVLILGAIIVSSLSSLKKKQQEPQPQPQPSQPQSWEEMMMPPPAPAPKKKKKAPPVPRAQYQRAQSSLKASEEGESMFGNSPILAEETETVIIDNLGLTDADAFRKAIIYAEILNRKY
jgi:hypothetical protein